MQADICRLLQAVPRSMSACMREFFQRMHALDPQLRSSLADWLAYHLSNFDFMWPWAKWSYVLQAPAHDAQRFLDLYFAPSQCSLQHARIYRGAWNFDALEDLMLVPMAALVSFLSKHT